MALEGTLIDLPLTDLLEIFEMGAKSGVLIVMDGSRRGAVYVREGQLIDAVLIDRAQWQEQVLGEPAMRELLRWTDGSFTFGPDVAVHRRATTIQSSFAWRAADRGDDQRVLVQQDDTAITSATRVEPGPHANDPNIWMGLAVDQWRILEYATGSTTVDAIAAATRLTRPEVIAYVTELVAAHVLKIASPAAPAPAAPRADPPPARTGGLTRAAAPRFGTTLMQAIQRRLRSL